MDKWLWLWIATGLLLSACGFTLKGRQDYAFERLYISPSGTTSAAMVARLKRLIQSNGHTVVVDSAEAADATLSIAQTRSQNVLTINATGLVEEYELNLSVNYWLTGADGAVLIQPSWLRLNRSMTYSDQFALAKLAESNLLYRDMENDAADQLLRRLAAVRTPDPARHPLPAVQPRTPLPTPPL